MKRIILATGLLVLLFSSCRWAGYKRITGNGNVSSVERHVGSANRIKLSGSYDVEITQGPAVSVKVEADENLIPYILTNTEDGFLVIHSKDRVNISTEHTIKIYITTPAIDQVNVSGSGNVTGMNKFTGSNKLALKVSGSGNIQLSLNAPDITADITGSGSIILRGETKNETVHIAGSGDYTADELKAEDAAVNVTGSGNVKIFADNNLDIRITGSGSIYYKGAASVKQRVTGNGDVKKVG